MTELKPTPAPVTPKKVKAVAYIRVSTDKQEISPEAQLATIRSWAHMNDIEIIHVYEDVCSGGTPWVERENLPRAVAMVKRRRASWLVVSAWDRLSRDLYNGLHLKQELGTAGARAISCTESPRDEASPESNLLQDVVAAFAQFERAKIRTRIKAALAVRKRQGVKLGTPSYAETAHGRCIIHAVWLLKDEGYGAPTIAKKLHILGIVGPRGGDMHERSVQRILSRPRPTVEPKEWRGLEDTWKQFERVNPRAEDPNGSRNDFTTPWRSKKGIRPRRTAKAIEPVGEPEQNGDEQ